MRQTSSKKIAFYGVLSALMFVFLLIETYLLTIAFGSLTPAILTLPFAVSLSLFLGKKGMFVGGTIFGCCSFFLAIMIGNPIFINPLISILPRILIGVIAYFVFILLKSLFKNSKKTFVREVLPYSIAGAFGILTNTVCTITMLWVFTYSSLAAVFTTIISINFVGEIIGALILVPVYSKILKRIDNNL